MIKILLQTAIAEICIDVFFSKLSLNFKKIKLNNDQYIDMQDIIKGLENGDTVSMPNFLYEIMKTGGWQLVIDEYRGSNLLQVYDLDYR